MPALRRGHGDVAYRSNPSQAKRLWDWPRLESSAHRLRLARDDGEVGTRGLIRLRLALFPIPERAEGDTKASRKLLLRKTKRAAHHLDLRDALEVRGPLRRQRRVVRIVQRRRVDFLLRHGIQRCPISPFGRKRPRRSVGKHLDEGFRQGGVWLQSWCLFSSRVAWRAVSRATASVVQSYAVARMSVSEIPGLGSRIALRSMRATSGWLRLDFQYLTEKRPILDTAGPGQYGPRGLGAGWGKGPDFLRFRECREHERRRARERGTGVPAGRRCRSLREAPAARRTARPRGRAPITPNRPRVPAGRRRLGDRPRLPALDRARCRRAGRSAARLVPRPRARDLAVGDDRVRTARLRGGRDQRGAG